MEETLGAIQWTLRGVGQAGQLCLGTCGGFIDEGPQGPQEALEPPGGESWQGESRDRVWQPAGGRAFSGVAG